VNRFKHLPTSAGAASVLTALRAHTVVLAVQPDSQGIGISGIGRLVQVLVGRLEDGRKLGYAHEAGASRAAGRFDPAHELGCRRGDRPSIDPYDVRFGYQGYRRGDASSLLSVFRSWILSSQADAYRSLTAHQRCRIRLCKACISADGSIRKPACKVVRQRPNASNASALRPSTRSERIAPR
jgi:hypothetical protein